MEKILVSACLLGDKTRYDGEGKLVQKVKDLNRDYDLVPFCPEVEGGLPTPRPKSEIQSSGRVVNIEGRDVTHFYDKGAEKALNICRFLGIRIAILKDLSPACGSRFIYDGSFKKNKIEGLGVTAKLLIANGIKVYSENDNLDFLIPVKEEKKEEEIERKPRERNFRGKKSNYSTRKPYKKNFHKSFKKKD